jgi:hypothetical protein
MVDGAPHRREPAVTAIGLGVAWAAVVAVLLAEHRRPVRVPGGPYEQRDAGPGAGGPSVRWQPVCAIGRALRRLARRPPDPDADRRVGWAAVAALVLVPWAPPIAAVPVAWAAVAPGQAARRARRTWDVAFTDQLPDVVDLVALTTAAGLPVAGALCAIGRRPGGPLGEAIARAAGHIERGGATAAALDLLADTAGPLSRPLVAALAAHDRYGTPLAPALERAAIDSRARRRRQAEQAARRLPVTLLFPLVLTILPAFALLTVVPLLAGSFGSLRP